MIIKRRCLFGARTLFRRWLTRLIAGFLLCLLIPHPASATALSDPQVDAYNVHIGTETFAGMYQFTTNTLLVETAEAITNMGSDVIKLYLGSNTSFQSGLTAPPNVTNLLTLARDEPSYREVLDMPFRNFVMWTYPFANSDEWWGSGYNSTQGAKDYAEMYDLTCYLLTNYNNSGKTFYLGHWEGDGYLEVNNWSTNPSPATIQGMIGWLNNRQKAVDDAKAATAHTNVNVFNYAECNRVRDAMLNGPTNNERVINMVIPYITNLDYLSYSSYDAQNLSTANLYATLDYMESKLPAGKAGIAADPRIWIGEYGWGADSTDAQEPLNRAYIQRLLNWSHNGRCLPFILYWEMYSNYNPGGKTNFCLIDYQDSKVASWYLHNYFYNDARLLVAQFKENNARLPTDSEFVSLVNPLLNQPIPAPVPLVVTNVGFTMTSSNSANVSGVLAQGIYGDDEAAVWLVWGRQDSGTNFNAWENSHLLGINTHFNPTTYTAVLTNLSANTNYFYRFFAVNANGSAFSASSLISTTTLNPADFGSRLKITFNGYNRSETLLNFPVLMRLGTNVPGFSYHQFASSNGSDLRFADASGLREIPYEIDEWNPNGISTVWVQIPALSSANDFIWAYWGNPAATNSPAYTTNGAVWQPASSPSYDLVYHLEQTGFPYRDSTTQYPATSGIAPTAAPGLIGQAAAFSASPYLDAGAVNLGGAFTMSAWVNISSSINNIQGIWANGPGGYGVAECAFYVNDYNTTDGALIFATGNGSTGAQVETPTGAVSFNQWHFVTAVVDHSGGTAQLYVDGNLQATGAVRNDFPTAQDMNLGRYTSGSFAFRGLIDEARICGGLCSSNWVWANWMTVASNAVFESYASVGQNAPSLAFGNDNNAGMFLSWPGSGVGFALHQATNLAPPVIWMPATSQPILTNNQWRVYLPTTNASARFYRLQSD